MNSENEEIQAQLALMIAAINEMLEPITEATSGYRESMRTAGFSVDAANQMAVHYHEVLMDVVRRQVFGRMHQ